MQKIEVKSYKMKSWEAFLSWNYVLHFFLNFFTDFFYFWYGTPNRYWDYLCEISSSYFGWFGRYLAWGGTLSGLVWRWPWSNHSKFTMSQNYIYSNTRLYILPNRKKISGVTFSKASSIQIWIKNDKYIWYISLKRIHFYQKH